MIAEFEAEALDYLLGEMDGGRRAAFEQKLTRFPAAQAAVFACGESLAALRRQALEIPFFGESVGAEISRLLQTSFDPSSLRPREAEAARGRHLP